MIPRTGTDGILGYLEQAGQPVTAEQAAEATGQPLHLVRAVLREAGDRGWAEHVPGRGWRLPPLREHENEQENRS